MLSSTPRYYIWNNVSKIRIELITATVSEWCSTNWAIWTCNWQFLLFIANIVIKIKRRVKESNSQRKLAWFSRPLIHQWMLPSMILSGIDRPRTCANDLDFQSSALPKLSYYPINIKNKYRLRPIAQPNSLEVYHELFVFIKYAFLGW